MKTNVLAVAAAVLMMLGATGAVAAIPQGGHAEEATYSSTTYSSNGNISIAQNDSGAPARVLADEPDDDEGGSSGVTAASGESSASGAAATYIATSDDTCMGSSSVGGQGDAFGFSTAAAWTDRNCITVKNARELLAQGHPAAARARLCMDEDNAFAFELAGEPCPRVLPSTQAALAKIRTAHPDYVAAAEPSVQLAMLGDTGGNDTASTAGSPDGGGSQAGTLLAMVQSAVHTVTGALAAASAADPTPEPYTLYGIE